MAKESMSLDKLMKRKLNNHQSTYMSTVYITKKKALTLFKVYVSQINLWIVFYLLPAACIPMYNDSSHQFIWLVYGTVLLTLCMTLYDVYIYIYAYSLCKKKCVLWRHLCSGSVRLSPIKFHVSWS